MSRTGPESHQHPPDHAAPVGGGEGSPHWRARKSLLGEEQLRGMIGDTMNELAAELAQGKSDRLQQYLDFAARFHQYSRGNQLLIRQQRPDATRVASYRKWQDEGYQVAKGETGIRILAPSTRRRRDEETGEEERVVVGFVAVSVFDQSQLTERPPDFFTPLEGDYEAFCARAVQAITTDGFEVEESDATDGAQGYNRGRRIVVRRSLTSANRALTLLHEYAHGLLHRDHELAEGRPLSREVKEAHAEAVAYCVARHFGIPTPFSADYLLHWSATPDRLRAELDAVTRAAGHIIRGLHALQPGEVSAHDPDEVAGDQGAEGL